VEKGRRQHAIRGEGRKPRSARKKKTLPSLRAQE
jgi:hypothetical protein